MTHTVRDRTKLVQRVRRLRGQLDGVERLLSADADCDKVLQQIAACHGAINGLMTEVLEDHIRYHVIAPHAEPDSEQALAGEQLLGILRSYLR